MSTNIVVRGLPGNVRFTKLLSSFRMLFKKAHLRQFWIRGLSDDGEFKQATVEVPNNADAIRALDYLNTIPFKHNMMEFPMQAYISEESTPFYNENDYEDWGRSGPRTKRRPKRRARSRSPGYHQASDVSRLDMEIELLRRQRQVVEEERRLLMEQQKLEMMKDYGSSASDDFENFKDFLLPRKRRQPEPVLKRPSQKSPPRKIPKIPKQPTLPLFFQPCKKLVAQMRPIIERESTADESEILTKLIRAAIRKDLALALEDKDYMKHADIINLFRERHPKEQDEAFVAKILANIRASYLNTDADVVVKAVKGTENVAKDTENQVNDKGEGKNIQENGNETDAATNIGAVNEPAKSQPPGNPVKLELIQPEIDFTVDITADPVVDQIRKEQEEEWLGDGETKPTDWIEEQ